MATYQARKNILIKRYKEIVVAIFRSKIYSLLFANSLVFSNTLLASDIGQTGVPLTKIFGTELTSLDGQDDFGADIIRDAQGNLYITGGYNSTSYGVAWSRSEAFNFFIAKYDAEGNEIWLNELDTGWNKDDRGLQLAMDSLGYVYVLGRTRGGEFGNPGDAINAFIAKYTEDGVQLWIEYIPATTEDISSLAIDEYDGIYAAGHTTEDGTSDSDAVLYKYDTDGNQQWRNKYDNTMQDSNVHVVYEKVYNYVMLGFTRRDPTDGDSDIALKRLNTNGNQVGSQDTVFAGSDTDTITAMTAGYGNVFIGGHATSPGTVPGPFGAPSNGMYRPYYLASIGTYWMNVNWVDRLYAEDGGMNIQDIAVDGKNRIHITGGFGKNAAGNITGGGTPNGWGNDVLYMLYSTGGYRYTLDQMGAYGTRDTGHGIVADADGNFYITGGVGGPMNDTPTNATINSSDIFLTRNMPR